MEKKMRIHLEQVLDTLRASPQQTTTAKEKSKEDQVIPADEIIDAPALAPEPIISPPPGPEPIISPPPATGPKTAIPVRRYEGPARIPTIRVAQKVSRWQWLIKGLRDDKISAILVLSLLLCGTLLACVALWYILTAII
jgi:hypothetical protein